MEKEKHYFIIGGSTLQYNFAKEVKDNGYKLHIFDYDPKCRCIEIADYFHCVSIDKKEEILEIAKKYRPIAVSTTACEVGNISACYVAEKLGLDTNTYETALNTTDKSRMKKIFKKFDIPNANYLEVSKIEEINLDKINFPVVVKPSDRSAGRGVCLAENKKEFIELFNDALKESFNKKVLIEEVLVGKQFSVETITYLSKHQIVAYTEEYFDGSKNFIENQQMIPARLGILEKKELEEVILKTLDAFEIKFGCCHIEVKLTSEGFKVIEIASRMGGWRDVLVKYAYNDNFNKMLLDSTTKQIPKITHEGKNYALVKMIFNKTEYEFYKKIKSETPELLVHDEVKEYKEYNSKNLADAQGFYYLCVPKTMDVDYYIEGSNENK